MRKLWLVPAIGLALLLVLLLLRERPASRGGGGFRGEEGHRAPPSRAATEPQGEQGTSEERAKEGDGGSLLDDRPRATTWDGRLVFLDGAPAVGVTLHLAVGRPVDVRVFRNGEYTDKTVYLVTIHDFTTTGTDGTFRFRVGVDRPARSRAYAYTAKDPQAFVVEEFTGGGQVLRARRIVKVSGRLVDHDGSPRGEEWLEGRFGKPEDWQTRVLREEDSFVAATGDLNVDTLSVDEARTKADGSFSLRLAEGRNTLVFGEMRAEGSIGVDVVQPATELGELRVPGATLLEGEHSISGRVLTLAGAPHGGCDVLAWDGSVGPHTHAEMADEEGQFTISGLKSPNVILWAVPTERRHIDLPIQTSGTLRMPCDAPILLHAPAENEYAWARIAVPGFYLFVRTGVFAAGEALDKSDVVGLPPGPLHIYLLTEQIREATLDIREPGDLLLASEKFRDTTWQ